MAVAYAIEQGNVPQIDKVFSGLVAPAFVKSPVMVNLIGAAEDVPEGQNTKTKSFRKEGSLTAATLAEATVLALSANGERTDTTVDVSAAKVVAYSAISNENQKFTDTTLDSYARSQASAIGRYVDDVALAEFAGFTQSVDAGATLTVDHLDQAASLILASNVPSPEMPLQFVGSVKAIRHIKADIRTSGGAMWSNTQFLSVFNGNPSSNGFAGSLPGYDIYQTSGFTSGGGQDSLGMFHPMYALCGIFDPAVSTLVEVKGAGSGLLTELSSWFYFGIETWNDLAGCEILLNT